MIINISKIKNKKIIPENHYIKSHCTNCKYRNRIDDICYIRMRLDGSYNCLNYKKDKLLNRIKKWFKNERGTNILKNGGYKK